MSLPDVALLRRSAQQGSWEAQLELGRILKCAPELGSVDEAVQWLCAAVDQGSGEACLELADIYLLGELMPQNFARALPWLERGAELNHPDCLYNLGVMYIQGAGFPPDEKRAVELFRRGAVLGNTNSQYNLAYCLCDGRGVTADPVEALFWALRVQEAGDPRSQTLLAKVSRAMPSQSVSLSTSEAAQLTQALVQQMAASEMEERRRAAAAPAKPTPQPPIPPRRNDLEQLRIQAKGGEVSAQLELAKLLRDKGLHDEAADWFLQASRAGSSEAKFQIGLNFQQGLGVPQSPVRARRWFTAALENGHPDAQAHLDEIEPEIQRRVAQGVSLIDAAERGDARAMYQLAEYYADGHFADVDRSAAYMWYRRSADLGHSRACMKLCQCYEVGFGVEAHEDAARYWLLESARRKDPEAISQVAQRSAAGKLVADSPAAAAVIQACRMMYPELRCPGEVTPTIYTLVERAENGDRMAQYLAATAALRGETEALLKSDAERYLAMAARQDYAPAQCALARLTMTEARPDTDTQQAKELLMSAARQGYLAAMTDLVLGFGVDPEELQRTLAEPV